MRTDYSQFGKVVTIAMVLALPALAGCLGGQPPATGGLSLKLGTMMPLTGALNSLGPDMQGGAKLAIEDVNAAGAGITIQAFHEDDKTTDTSAAPNTFNRLVAQGATAIAGPCCSGVTASILDLAVANKVVISTPSATSPALTDRDNKGFFWRVVPSDALQGRVLADLVSENNHTTVAVIFVNNAYGTGLTRVFEETFTSSLSGVVTKKVGFDEQATTFSSEVDQICAVPLPEAVVFVVYTDHGAAILKEMNAKGCLGQMKLYASEGVYDSAASLATKAGKDDAGNFLAAGMKGTNPSTFNPDYTAKYKAKYGHDPLTYSPESYDAVIYVALAALKANSTKGPDIAANLKAIANAPGDKCTTFKACADLIKAGKEIDYVGVAHDFDFDAKNEPENGVYIWWEIQADGTMKTIAEGKTG